MNDENAITNDDHCGKKPFFRKFGDFKTPSTLPITRGDAVQIAVLWCGGFAIVESAATGNILSLVGWTCAFLMALAAPTD